MKAESVEEYVKSISSIKKCEDIIEKYPELIVFVDEKFKKDLAVKAFNNGYLPAIEYISAEDQTPQIAKTAVEGNGLLIKFIHNPTLALLRTAVRNNPMVLALMDDKLKN